MHEPFQEILLDIAFEAPLALRVSASYYEKGKLKIFLLGYSFPQTLLQNYWALTVVERRVGGDVSGDGEISKYKRIYKLSLSLM